MWLLASISAVTGCVQGVYLAFGIFLFLWYFYRVPRVHYNTCSFMSPTTGKILKIQKLDDGRTKVFIFLSAVDPHVQFVPTSGVVRSVVRRKGLNALATGTDDKRNSLTTIIDSHRWGKMEIIQNTGLVARRLVSFLKPGQRVETGELLGLIKFGSRVDIVFEHGLIPMIVEGENLQAGQEIEIFS